MSDRDAHWPAGHAAPGLSPQRVRAARFARTGLGRRGLDPDEVASFLDQVADELARRDEREAGLRADAERHKRALRAWNSEHARRNAPDPHEAHQARVDAVNLMSRAQQECDRYVRQTQDYCHSLTTQAEQQADALLAEAHHHAAAAAEQAAHDYRTGAGTAYSPDVEEFRRRLAWLRTFSDSLGAVGSQLGATSDALRYELDKLDTLATTDPEAP
jgi:DivIVA domain-containing protein